MVERQLEQLINRYRGVSAAQIYKSFRLGSPEPLLNSARDILDIVPKGYGECALLSTSWAAYLQDKYSVPAIVVAGDLKIGGACVFKTKKTYQK